MSNRETSEEMMNVWIYPRPAELQSPELYLKHYEVLLTSQEIIEYSHRWAPVSHSLNCFKTKISCQGFLLKGQQTTVATKFPPQFFLPLIKKLFCLLFLKERKQYWKVQGRN